VNKDISHKPNAEDERDNRAYQNAVNKAFQAVSISAVDFNRWGSKKRGNTTQDAKNGNADSEAEKDEFKKRTF
jgi:hypothetical protein